MKRTSKSAIVVGIAGIMGAGKSTVAAVFEGLGARLIDADTIGKELLNSRDVKVGLIETFGKGVTGARGEIDTAKLGRAAFKDSESARKLSELTREPLVSRIREEIDRLRDSTDMIVIDAALLPEWDSKDWLDILIVVDSDEEASVRRSCSDSRFRPGNVRSRMKHQYSRRRKSRSADIIIPNYGSLGQLRQRASKVFWTLMEIAGKG
jgi:dephospho-CoA kinase